ncbi:MAG: PAS domain-containing protein [SAR324 cluster bacterium]|nr:PAS domain-containing protein [SAR324 cluster bacterium]
MIPKKFEVQTKGNNWYFLKIIPCRTMENVIDGVVITFMDITDSKNINKEGENNNM